MNVAEDPCDSSVEFATICSFITQFGTNLELDFNIEELNKIINDQENLDESLVELHVKLLRKIRKYFIRDQWEKALIRFASGYSYEHAYQLESLGYLKTPPSIKLEILRRLLDAQFECNQKFKASVNLLEADKLRQLPLGRDINGNTYWQWSDSEGNFRLYKEEPCDHKSWKQICSQTDELKELIDELDKIKDDRPKGESKTEPYNPLPEIFPEFFEVKQDNSLESEEIVESSSENKSSKGGKKKGRRGKNLSNNGHCNLSTLPEEEEQQCDRSYLSNIESRKDIDSKEQIMTNGYNNLIETNCITTNRMKCFQETVEHSIESQINELLDDLLGKVISKLENDIPSTNGGEIPKPLVPAPKGRRKKKEKVIEETLPRRSSSRIQQLQQRRVADEEEKMKKRMIELEEKKKSAISRQDDDSDSCQAYSRTGHFRQKDLDNSKKKHNKKGNHRSKRPGRRKISWDRDDSDLSSSSSEASLEDEDLDEGVTFDNTNYDDEFACEEEETNVEPVIVKRARTARKSFIGQQDETFDETIIEEDTPCRYCDKSNDPDWILLCDMCDDGYHTMCCIPPLMLVPDGNWYCPFCEHKMLLIEIRDFFNRVDALRASKVKKRKVVVKEIAPVIEEDEEFEDEEIEEPDDDDEYIGEAEEEEIDEEDDGESTEECTTEEDSDTSIDELVLIQREKKAARAAKAAAKEFAPRQRRAASQRVSYKEISDEESDAWNCSDQSTIEGYSEDETTKLESIKDDLNQTKDELAETKPSISPVNKIQPLLKLETQVNPIPKEKDQQPQMHQIHNNIPRQDRVSHQPQPPQPTPMVYETPPEPQYAPRPKMPRIETVYPPQPRIQPPQTRMYYPPHPHVQLPPRVPMYQTNVPIANSNPIDLNGSFDELAMPLYYNYNRPQQHRPPQMIPVHPHPVQRTVLTSNPICVPPSRSPPPVLTELGPPTKSSRDPIHALNQYCTQNVIGNANMINSYNQILEPKQKQSDSPIHPPFYADL